MNIKEARKAAGLTQQRMADIMEIPKRTIEDWESGRSNAPVYVEKLVIAELERIGKKMNEVKYLAIDEREHETFVNVFDTLKEANKDAESQWDHLTKSEKENSHIYVLDVKGSDLEDPDDWESYAAGGYCDGRFDSNKLYRVRFGTGAGDFEASDLDDAMSRAESNMTYTGEDVIISDWCGNDVVVSRWHGTEPDEEDKINMICNFGNEGFYDAWQEC